MRRVRVRIYGLVQGVFFRDFTRRNAQKLGVKGWVRNNLDGSVEAVFEGENEKVEELLKLCRKGPAGARVDSMQVEEEEFKNEFKDFRIKYL